MRSRWLWGLAVMALAVVALAAGCSKDDKPDPGATGNGGNGPGGAAANAYRNCLRQQGIELPTQGPRPTGDRTARPTAFPTARPTGQPSDFPGGPPGADFGRPSGVDDATWQKAQQECASLRPSFGPRGPRNGEPGGGKADAAYRNCLRDRGIPDGPLPATIDPTAAKACAVLSPTPTPTG